MRPARVAATATALVLAAPLAGCTHSPAAEPPAALHSTPAGSTRDGGAATPTGASHGGQDPAKFAAPVRQYATAAGIEPRLLMAILYNESYKPHDPRLERAWLRLDPNAALGVANMHRATFDETKRGHDFAGRDWTDLPDDPGLAVEAAAWYLHDLAADLPATWPARYTKDELLAMGYNSGPGSMRSYAQGGKPGSSAQDYLNRLHANWDAAGRALS